MTRTEYLNAIDALREAAQAYYHSDQVTLDDATYDGLVAALKDFEEANPGSVVEHGLFEVAAGTSSGGGDVVHSEKMYSLDNAMNDTELDAWWTRLSERVGDATLCVEPKLDGLAVTARYDNGILVAAATRGDGTVGEDVTHRVGRARGLPPKLTEAVSIEVRGEVYMSDADFGAANEMRLEADKAMFVNPRNGAAGALRTSSAEYPLSFAAYGCTRDTMVALGSSHASAMTRLEALGVSTARRLIDAATTFNIDGVKETIAAIAKRRSTLGCAIDGAVVKANELSACDTAGTASRAPRWAVAYKYPAEERRTKVLNITLQVGRTGVITPVAELEPVLVGGAMVSRATLSNPLEVQRKDIRIGDTVWVRRAGEVIPEIVAPDLTARDNNVEVWPTPQVCPRCASSINRSSKRWRCTNRSCGVNEALTHFVSRPGFDIEGFGSSVVQRCADAGLVATPSDIFALTVEQVAGLDRMGERSAAKLIDNIAASQSTDLHKVLFALGLSSVGRRLGTTLAIRYQTLTDVAAATVEELAALDKIGSVRAQAIVDDLARAADFVAALTALRIGQRNTMFGVDTAPSTGPLAGRSVVITGSIRGLGRDDAQRRAAELGATVLSRVSQACDLVIAGDKAGSKRAAAEAKGIEVMEGDTFADMCEANA